MYRIAVCAFSILFLSDGGYVASAQTDDEDAVVKQITAIPFSRVVRDNSNVVKPVTRVYLSDFVTDDVLRNLKKLKHIERLMLSGGAISDASISHLAELKHLKTLFLLSTKVTGTSFSELKGIPELQELILSRSPIVNAALVSLKELKGLRGINFLDTKITSEGLVHVKDLKKIEWLGINDTLLTKDGIVKLNNVETLDSMTIFCESNEYERHLFYLIELGRLRKLTLCANEVSDATVDVLNRMPHLKELVLEDCTISPERRSSLKKGLPKTQISFPN